jgi:hypothetical protein
MCKLTKLKSYLLIFYVILALCSSQVVWAQVVDTTQQPIPVDSAVQNAPTITDSAKIARVMKTHVPKKAIIRSAIIPGWGQAYNKKYWKIPIIYTALGISGSVFVYNLKNYKDLRFAYTAKVEARPKSGPNGTVIPGDSTKYWKIREDLLPIDINAIRSYRDEFRRNIDYSVLVFLLMWGLNVVDATVDAHLKAFDVSDDLSLRFRPGKSQMAGTTGLSLVLSFK